MNKEALIGELKSTHMFFKNSCSCLTDADSSFKPTEDSLSVAQQVAHVAQSIDWFIEGAFCESGFDMNFENHWVDVNKVTTLTEALEWLDKSIAQAMELVNSKTWDEWLQPLPEGPVMGGLPRLAIFSGITDHSAHHRGALTVYSRLLGKTPTMPYGG